MKITENDLDYNLQSKLSKINNIDSLKTEVDERFNEIESALDQIKEPKDCLLSMDNVNNLSKHLYKSDNNYLSAYDTPIVEDMNSYATTTLKSILKGNFLFQTESNILKIKTYKDKILILCSNGWVYSIDRLNTANQKKKDVLSVIKINYVYQNFDVYSITDIELYDKGVLIATEYNGIFYISLEDETYSLIAEELGVSTIKLLKDNKTLIISKINDKNNLILYNIITNTRLSAFNHLGLAMQEAIDICVDEKEFFVLGRSNTQYQSNKVLHYWRLDEAGIDFVNYDRLVAKNPSDNSYRQKLLKITQYNIFVCGLKDKKIFVWEYDKKNLNHTPLEFIYDLEDFEYDDLKDLKVLNNKFYITVKSSILAMDNDFKLTDNYKLGKFDIDSTKITENGVYTISNNECFIYSIPERIYKKSTDIQILSSECNNFEILAKITSGDQLIFINGITGEKVIPTLYIKIDETHVIKFKNLKVKNLLMRVMSNTETSKIYGLVIHKNRLFYNEE